MSHPTDMGAGVQDGWADGYGFSGQYIVGVRVSRFASLSSCTGGEDEAGMQAGCAHDLAVLCRRRISGTCRVGGMLLDAHGGVIVSIAAVTREGPCMLIRPISSGSDRRAARRRDSRPGAGFGS